MNRLFFLVTGALFGLVLYKSEVISWFRIQEMFRFQSFHMYGVIGSAIAVAALSLWLLRVSGVKSVNGESIRSPTKAFHHGSWIGGTLFGVGWALTGSCPGPLYAHLGTGSFVMGVALLAAIAGAWVYGLLKPRLPH